MNRWAILAGGLLFALGSHPAPAQIPNFGQVACVRCSALADLPTPTLFGFKLVHGDLDAVPDVLFDELLVGGVNLGNAWAPRPREPHWLFPSNWREPEASIDTVVAIVIDHGRIAFDAGPHVLQYFLAVQEQPACASGDGIAPLVRDIPGGHAVEWDPVLEENTTDILGGDGCTIGAESARGFIIGYNVYRLEAARFPSPTLRDFLVSGFVGHGDVQRLDFNVPDPDGMSGSDRDPTDNLLLRNPDGLPDTGDEVLVYLDAAAGPGAAWYRLQPVVRGSQAFFDSGLSGSSRVPADRLDLDGDGTRESIDIFRDGFVEFIDPSGRGLGLTYAGEIASSLRPGLGLPPTGTLGCGGFYGISGEPDCGNAIDDDLDGVVDCADSDCAAAPACMREDCGNGLDDDGDLAVDCADPDCVTASVMPRDHRGPCQRARRRR